MRAMFAYAPPGPEFVQPPPLWGVEDHVRSLLEPHGLDLTFERDAVEFRSPSVDDALSWYATTWGPFIELRELLEPEGRWEALRGEFAEILERRNEAADGTLAYRGDYLVVLGEKRRPAAAR